MNINAILFDLDDTLYPVTSGVWSLIRENIDLFMMSRLQYPATEVSRAREGFFRQYGTTLRGLEATHNIDPLEYLQFVHNVPIDKLITSNTYLGKMLSKIPLRKAIFTNADRLHAKRVLEALAVDQYFETIIDILDVKPFCKPMRESFEIALKKIGVNQPSSVLLIDDSMRNINTAQSLGMPTVWVNNSIDHHDYGGFQIKQIEDFYDIFTKIMES